MAQQILLEPLPYLDLHLALLLSRAQQLSTPHSKAQHRTEVSWSSPSVPSSLALLVCAVWAACLTRLMLLLSVVSAAVKSSPAALMAADTYSTADSDVLLSSRGMRAVPSAAPSLPAAALAPWAEARMAVGNSSLGMTKVVTLGPMLQKKNDSPYTK